MNNHQGYQSLVGLMIIIFKGYRSYKCSLTFTLKTKAMTFFTKISVSKALQFMNFINDFINSSSGAILLLTAHERSYHVVTFDWLRGQ